jgi:hypothetical protein
VRVYAALDEAGLSLMRSAMRQLQLSPRSFHRVLKLSCALADPAAASGQGVVVFAKAAKLVAGGPLPSGDCGQSGLRGPLMSFPEFVETGEFRVNLA